MLLSNRINTYAHTSAAFACLSDVKLSELLQQAKPLYSGIGGASALLTMDGVSLFVKKVPLTDLERLPRYIQSTANLFELPLFYQYGVGSAGFGAWRELTAHTLTTNWVLAGDCPNYPLLYYWRVLPAPQPQPMNAEQAENLERDVKYWENAPAVRNRLEAKHEASAHVVLFLEYVPQTLYQWLGNQLKEGGNTAEAAVSFVDKTLKATNDFMNARGFFHFDAHFENILTDGHLLYLSDFGLALSSQFDLTTDEVSFLKNHHSYDRCAAIVNLLHSVITQLFGKDHWRTRLQACKDGEQGGLTPPLAIMIKRYAPIALVMDEFYTSLQKESKSTPYPATHLEHLLDIIDGEGGINK